MRPGRRRPERQAEFRERQRRRRVSQPELRGRRDAGEEPGPDKLAQGYRAFVRYACKMATGTGKTTVMGMIAAAARRSRQSARPLMAW